MITRSARRRCARRKIGEGTFRARHRRRRVYRKLEAVNAKLAAGATVKVDSASRRWVSLRAIRDRLSTVLVRLATA